MNPTIKARLESDIKRAKDELKGMKDKLALVVTGVETLEELVSVYEGNLAGYINSPPINLYPSTEYMLITSDNIDDIKEHDTVLITNSGGNTDIMLNVPYKVLRNAHDSSACPLKIRRDGQGWIWVAHVESGAKMYKIL
jgi:hypothetical protein